MVEMELAPLLLAQADQYPLGQAMPGEKKAVGAELKPEGRHFATSSSMCNIPMLSRWMSEHEGSRAVNVVVSGIRGKEVIVVGV
jgi:hypothetical protein